MGGGGLVFSPTIVPHRLSCWQKVLMHLFYLALMKAVLKMRRSV